MPSKTATVRLALAACLFLLGLFVAVACGSHLNNGGTNRLTVTLTRSGAVTTITTGP